MAKKFGMGDTCCISATKQYKTASPDHFFYIRFALIPFDHIVASPCAAAPPTAEPQFDLLSVPGTKQLQLSSNHFLHAP